MVHLQVTFLNGSNASHLPCFLICSIVAAMDPELIIAIITCSLSVITLVLLQSLLGVSSSSEPISNMHLRVNDDRKQEWTIKVEWNCNDVISAVITSLLHHY